MNFNNYGDITDSFAIDKFYIVIIMRFTKYHSIILIQFRFNYIQKLGYRQ